jgi:hypothetical protein
MARELVDLKTIATRLHYSEKYLRNNWYRLLPGVRPAKLRPDCSRLLFFWDDVEKLLLKEK